MSKTPRTEAHKKEGLQRGFKDIVSGSFARQLVTELNEAKAEIVRLKEQLNGIWHLKAVRRKNAIIKQCLEALKWNCESCKYADVDGKPNDERQCAPCIMAIEAAEKELKCK